MRASKFNDCHVGSLVRISVVHPPGFLWIGTHGGGVLVSDWKWNFIKQYNFKEDNEVESIIIDDEKRIYLSTYEQGIFVTEPYIPIFILHAA